MKEENGFLRFFRRFNILLLTVVGLGFLVMQGNLLLDWLRSHEMLPILHHEEPLLPPPAPQFTYRLDGVPGTDLFGGKQTEKFYALVRNDRFGGFGYPPARPEAVNILAVDRATNANRWLFKGIDREILSENAFYVSVAKEEASADEGVRFTVAGLAMVVADADTNNDGAVDAGDRQSLYVYRMDGKEPVKVLTAEYIGLELTAGAKTCLVFYQDSKSAFAATYSVPDMKLLTKAPIAELPKLEREMGPRYQRIGFTGVER